MHRPISTLPPPPPSTTTPTMPFQFPPSSIQIPTTLDTLPPQLTSPHALRFPAAWRCGSCGATHAVLDLMSSPPSRITTQRQQEPTGDEEEEYTGSDYCCARPALQAVYDQFGHIYLLWRDDPAVADLRDPRSMREARWRVWKAGGGWWDVVLPGRRFGFGGVEGEGEGEEVEGDGVVGRGERGKRPLRRWTTVSQSSMASDVSEDSLDTELMGMEQ